MSSIVATVAVTATEVVPTFTEACFASVVARELSSALLRRAAVLSSKRSREFAGFEPSTSAVKPPGAACSVLMICADLAGAPPADCGVLVENFALVLAVNARITNLISFCK